MNLKGNLNKIKSKKIDLKKYSLKIFNFIKDFIQ
jgi:hypothetical protein